MDTDVSEMTPQQRADKIGCMIKAEVDAGRFKVAVAFIRRRRVVGEPVCQGCAIGSLAFALGCHTEGIDREGCHSHIERAAPGLISQEERAQLEMGYEAWTNIQVFHHAYEADKVSPFFQLGRRMSIASNHRSEAIYAMRGML